MVSNLRPDAVAWNQILNSNLLPKDKDLELVDPIEKDLLLLLNSDLKIDLPQVMFDYLMRTLSSFHKGKIFFIPYGRVISELLVQQGVIISSKADSSKIWRDKFEAIYERF